MKSKVNLRGKRILVVDDEPDVLGVVEEVLHMCVIETAPDFDTAATLIESDDYEAAILDIMGVRGYDLLEITEKRGIPALMLTAHALTPEDFVKSMKMGAHAYLPKDKLADLQVYLEDILEAREKGIPRLGKWFRRLEAFFEEKFGSDWKEKSDPDFWKKNYYL